LQTTRGHSQWAGTELQAQYDWRIRRVGGELDSTAAQSATPAGVVGRRTIVEPVWAAYLQQQLSPLPALHLNGGLRFDADPRGGQRLSPRAAVAVDPWKGETFKCIYSEAFRAPTFYEAYFESPQQRPSPDIRSEVVRSVEVSAEQRAGAHRILFGVYRTWWSDMISLETNPDGTYQYRNVSTIDNYGYNALIDGALGEFQYGLSATGAHTRRNTPAGAEPLPVAPQFSGNARVSYDLPGVLPVVALAATVVGPRPADRALDGNFAKTPYAPVSAELRVTFSEHVPGLPSVRYRIGATYVTSSESPYVAGPTQIVAATASIGSTAELAPVNRFAAFGTVQYDLPL
jgi:outer membrane cobalamin receptor